MDDVIDTGSALGQLRLAAAGCLVNLSGGDGEACVYVCNNPDSLDTLRTLLAADDVHVRRCGATVVCNLVLHAATRERVIAHEALWEAVLALALNEPVAVIQV